MRLNPFRDVFDEYLEQAVQFVYDKALQDTDDYL